MDYPVANFGQDHDIQHSLNSERVASELVGHKWDWKEIKGPDVPTYEIKPLDVDMQDSLRHLGNSESKFGTWDIP